MVEQRQTARIVLVFFLLAACLPLFGNGPEDNKTAFRQYFVEARLFSMQPNEGIGTYRLHSEAGGSANGTLGLAVADNDRRFTVSVQGRLKSHHFWATVEVKPGPGDTQTRAQKHEYDLSDVRPRTLEIARDPDGCVYRLNLMPRVVEHPKPQPFRVGDLRLENWSFPASPVILNDQDYIGQLGMSNGPLAWCDIPGLAKIEFSLLHLKDAQPWGSLKDGIIDITHENDTTLRITNVKNGIHRQVLEGGPYQVWVR